MARRRKLPPAELEETYHRIIGVAERLFFKYGYRAVTTRQVAEACGLTQPALYYHFANKQDLYLAMMTETLNRQKTSLERLARRQESVSERLRLMAMYLLNSNEQNMELMFHDIRYELDAHVQTQLEQVFMECEVGPLVQVFEEGIEQGQLRSPRQGGVTAVTAAFLFLNLVSQFLTQKHENGPLDWEQSDSDTARLIVQLQLHGLAAPDALQS